MSEMPIYSQVAPKGRDRGKKSTQKSPNTREFDPLNYNHGGNLHILNAPLETRMEKLDKAESKKKKEDARRKKVESSEGKVEAYLRQNQVNIRQHRHSAVRQAEHRLNLRSLPLNEVTGKPSERTPTDRHRGFPGDREHRRERDRNRDRERERDRDRDRDTTEFDTTPLSPQPRERNPRSRRTWSEPAIAARSRRFFCREWVFQKIAHCLEQRPTSKVCGALIIGDAGSGKTAICQELNNPSGGAQARQQRALSRRLLAAHFLQSENESSLRPGEFIRSLAMQILSHGSRKAMESHSPEDRGDNRRDSDEEKLINRFRDLSGDDGEESSKPLLADEEQRTDEDECPARRTRTIDRLHESEAYCDTMPRADDLPEILPRSNTKSSNNPFLNDNLKDSNDSRLYENHENVFLRNISQRSSKESRNSRLIRQSSEPLSERKTSMLQKSLSTEQRSQPNEHKGQTSEQKSQCIEQKTEEERKVENSPPKSRIPVANFRYPNKSDLKVPSVENSPAKKAEDDRNLAEKSAENAQKIDGCGDENGEELPEYQNIMKREQELLEDKSRVELEILLEKKRAQSSDVPPPIPSLPVSPRTLIANAYYEKLMSEPEIQQALLPQNLEKNPDECLKKALLFPLLEIDPPKQCLFLLIDAIDEGIVAGQNTDSTEPSTSVATLISRHQHLFPHWLLLVCTASKGLNKMLTGFRKITLDELQRAHVSADVQRYVLARLDTEHRLRARVSCDSSAAAAAAAALDHLRIKSDGCLLYLEKVLDGVADGFIALREIREIPGTLNGLYLWLAQRLFHGRRFTKVRLLLDVLLAARCGITEEMLYKCLLTKEYSVTRDDFNRRLHLLRRILVLEPGTGHVCIFHQSFARWLLDVKHCTRRYLCAAADGHAALAMYYTLTARSLSAMEIHNFVYHMTQLEAHMAAQKKNKNDTEEQILDLHTIILLWVLDSGCDLEAALKKDVDFNKQLAVADGDQQPVESKNSDAEAGRNGDDKRADTDKGLESVMAQLCAAGWPRHDTALVQLLKLRDDKPDQQTIEQQTETEDAMETSVELEEPVELDPNLVFELAAKGDDEALGVLLKRHSNAVLVRDGSGGTALHTAARAGRASTCGALLRAGADTHASDNDGWTPLRAAAWAGHPEVVDVLLDYGCDVDCVDSDNRTALRAAAWSGHSLVVRRLLQAGAEPERADAEGRTPLMAAAYMGHADIVHALLQAGAAPDHADHDGRTALSVAALCSTGAACATLLLEKGADVSKADRDGATPLLVAAFEGHTEMCELLLENEADIEASDASGRTALWAAAAAGHARCVRLLLFWGASVDNMDAEGRTVLSAAAAQGNVEVVRQLLDRGLDENHRDNSGWTPLHYAAFEGHAEVCEALLEAGGRIEEADNDGKAALHLAAQEGHAALVAAMLQAWAAPVDQRAHDGKTALRLAALEGHTGTVEVLWGRGADADALDADRRSTLYVLALDNRVAAARHLLVHCRASVTAADTEGRTPLHVAAWQGHTEMVNLLIKVGGACVDVRDRCRRTALHAAAWRGRGAALLALLRHGADPAAVCTQGATPLGIAAQEGHEECVMWLLQHGADPLQADHAGRTPAKVAWRAGHANICRILSQWAAPSAPAAPIAPLTDDTARKHAANTGSPDHKRRSVHSNSTKSSSNVSHEHALELAPDLMPAHDKANRANLSLSFAQQVARVGRGRRDRDRDSVVLEQNVVEKDSKLRSYAANERDAELRAYANNRQHRSRRGCERDSNSPLYACERDNASPLYASPPRSPSSDVCSPTGAGSQPPSLTTVQPVLADTHFNRDTHMRIILGRDTKPQNSERPDSKSKRNGIVTNPAMRLVANVRNGLDSAAANIRRTGVALAASASSANPVVKSNAFQWRKETPL